MESAKIVQMIKTMSTRGNGTENDPYREVVQYWTLDGVLIAEEDNAVKSFA